MAWRSGGAALGADGVPAVLLERAGDSPALDAAIAACRLAHTSGTPLADVLTSCAAGIVEADAAEAARRVALAGPTSTARLLGWLPVVSLVAGTALGADPIGVVLAGGVGLVAVLGGVALMVLGRRWSAALVASAERGGEAG
ncbi:hypothetical protein Bcav_0620 [Beutenbergia cavernae DSM 12333]|uniref:Type II secretion system protein n=1 Tax=Beutenbergia cavernae (strain ATCC BAA-8 / DSM 12333 / CCUG 43141 / JCM 11478 / NBRC 16432 / NCIMB 13614 / HKI 0122) TaxID=471853 RepID=C5BXY8_BEUC1|nr:hypothetical protein Bcav_0620 [Beutenbergia cavernae DSM 12333]